MVLLVMMNMPLDAAAAAATWKLAMVSLLLLEAASFHIINANTHQLKRKKGEAKLIDARSPKPKDMAWYIQAAGDFSKEPRNISSPFLLCFFHEEAMATRATKRETKGANKRS